MDNQFEGKPNTLPQGQSPSQSETGAAVADTGISRDFRATVTRKKRFRKWIKRWYTILSLLVNIILVVAGFLVLSVYSGQLKVMQGQLDQMKSGSLQTKKLIDENHTLAESAKKQATDTHDLATTAGTQANVAKGALDLSRQSFHVSQRPYVTVENVRFDPPIEQNHNPATIKFDLHNAGRTPGLRGTHTIHAFIAGKEIERSPTDFPSELTIASDRSVMVSLSAWIRRPGDYEGIVDGTLPISIKGSARYSDIFKEWHTTTFCAVYDGKVTKTWLYCPGNDVK